MKVIAIIFVSALVIYLPVVLGIMSKFFDGVKACGIC